MRRLANDDGVEDRPGDDRVESCFEACSENGFWLDLEDASEGDLRLLEDVFKFHPLTLDEIRKNAIRPRLDEFEGYAFMTLGTAEWVHQELHLAAFHLFVGHGFLVTLHREPSDELDGLIKRLSDDPEPAPLVTYLAISSLIDSLFPALDELDREIDLLQDRTMANPSTKVLAELHRVQHEVADLRRMLGNQIDGLQRLVTHMIQLHVEDQSVYFRNVHDRAVRQHEIVDSFQDLLTSATDVYLSTVANRLGATMRQLTVIAGLFLPLIFLTGFLGMNFQFLISHLDSPAALAIAITVIGLSICVQLWIFRQRGLI